MVRIIYNFRRRLGKVRAEVINHVPILEGSMIPINSFHQMKFPEVPNLIDIVQQMDRWLSQTNQKIFTRFSSSSLIFSFLKIPAAISVHFIFFFFLCFNFDFHPTSTKVCESKPSSNFLIFEFFMNRQHSGWILNPLIPNSNFFFNLRVRLLCVWTTSLLSSPFDFWSFEVLLPSHIAISYLKKIAVTLPTSNPSRAFTLFKLV